MNASCGPSNPLSSLSKHSDRDASLLHLRRGPVANSPQFRLANTDPRLNQEFAVFANPNTFAPQYQDKAFAPAAQNGHAWVQDFSDLSLRDPQQFAHKGPRPQAHSQPSAPSHMDYRQQVPSQRYSTSFTPIMNMRTNLSLPVYPDEHHEMHAMEQNMISEQEAFENEFSMVEALLSNEAPLASTSEAEKNEFAETARKVKESLTVNRPAEMAEKLEQSGFLKLMTQLSSREMELEGDKFVPSTRESASSGISAMHLPDPLAHMRHNAQHREGPAESNTAPNQGSSDIHGPHLPDPLAHVADGSLDSNLLSLQAAQVISNHQVAASDWMEDEAWLGRSPPNLMHKDWQQVYDDYRHDDDAT